MINLNQQPNLYLISSKNLFYLEFIGLQLQFNGTEILRKKNKFKIDFVHPAQYLLIQSLNSKVKEIEIVFIKNNNKILLKPEFITFDNCIIINFIPKLTLDNIIDYSINFSTCDQCYLHLESEQDNLEEEINIYIISTQITKICNGMFGLEYSK